MKRITIKSLIIIIIVVLSVVVIIFNQVVFNKENKSPENLIQKNLVNTSTPALNSFFTNILTPTFSNSDQFLVPVTGFKQIINNINLADLQKQSIEVLASEKDIISSNFPQLKLVSINDTDFIEKVANEGSVGLISWQKLVPELKLLSVNDQNFFDKTIDRNKYPLKFISTDMSFSSQKDFNVNDVNRVISTGEIIPSRTVDKIMRLRNDYKYTFESVKPFLDTYDARLSTLESPLLGQGNGANCALGCLTFVANEKFSEGLKYSGVNLVTLADNHSMNAGIAGIKNTLNILDAIGIKHVGAAITNNEDATDPAILEVNGIKLGVLSYNDIPSVNDWATETQRGTGRIDDNSYHILPGRVAKDVQRAKDKGAQFIIAMMHWGAREYTNDPLPHQQDLAHNLVDNGVDLVIGDHPHWVMSTEFYTPKNSDTPKFIYYGIGNFIFDQDWSTETSQGSLLEMDFYKNKLLNLHIYPHHIYSTQPRIVNELSPEYKQIMDRIWQYTGRM